MKKVLLTLLLILPLATVHAADNTRLPEGVTSLNLTVTETQEVKQDLIIAQVRYETKGPDAKSVQNQINTKIKAGLDAIQGYEGIKISTQAYQVYMSRAEVIEMQGTRKVTRENEQWHGSQMIMLEGKDPATLRKLTGILQDMGLAVSQFSYTLSPALAEEIRQTLMQGAVAKIKDQADQAAKLLGKKGYEIREISIDGGYAPPMPMMRMEMAMASDAKMAEPNIEAGEQSVSMTLSARVELK